MAIAALALLVASEWTYIQRLNHYSKELPTPPEWFQPKEIVRGTSNPRPLGRLDPSASPIPTNILAQSIATAKEGNALSFLVVHDGAILAEFYAPGHSPTKIGRASCREGAE